MSEKNKQIAMRIKSLREISGASAETVAKKLKVPKELYASYENGTVDIPVSFLYEVAGEFKAELTSLLTGEEPKLRGYSLVRRGKGPSANRRKEYDYRDLAYNFKHKKAEIFLITVEPLPDGGKHKPNSHPGQEFTYLLEGKLKIDIGGHEIDMNEGDSLYFDPKQEHAMSAMGGKPAKFIAVIL